MFGKKIRLQISSVETYGHLIYMSDAIIRYSKRLANKNKF